MLVHSGITAEGVAVAIRAIAAICHAERRAFIDGSSRCDVRVKDLKDTEFQQTQFSSFGLLQVFSGTDKNHVVPINLNHNVPQCATMFKFKFKSSISDYRPHTIVP